MFKSKHRAIVIPQSEHGRLAGILAHLWGNEQFELPAVSGLSFIKGIGLHDRGYGFLDTFAIGETPEPEWLKVTYKGFYLEFSDQVADLIVKLHLKRLVRSNHFAKGQSLVAEMEEAIRNQVRSNGFSQEEFERVDRITNFCDSVSFDFCFEQATQDNKRVFPSNTADTESTLHYELHSPMIWIDPWPFSVPSFSSYLIGYQLESYPIKLEPVIVPFAITKKRL
jgi:hypothetical protein